LKKKIPQRLLSARPIAWFRQPACPPTIRSSESDASHGVRGVFAWLGDVGHVVGAACRASFYVNVTTAPDLSPIEEQAVSRCVDEETLTALITGTLAGDDLALIDAHLARCAVCRSVLADAAHGAVASTVADPALRHEDCIGTGSAIVAK
jgi:hypothetical protein